MELIDRLSKRVLEAAQEILNLKKERQALQSELEFLRQEQTRYQTAIRESERLNRDQGRLKIRLERLNKSLEKVMSHEERS